MDLDRISILPGHITDQILCLLPIRDAVRTSVLSRKWRFMWSKIPNLVFDDNCFSSATKDQAIIKRKLVNIVDHVLLLHKGPIRSFKLSHRDLHAIGDIDRWILHLFRVSVKEFILDIWVGQGYKLPSSLFYFENLIHLELLNCLLIPPPTFKGFRNLKSLNLQEITMTQDAFETIISNCLLLQKLTLIDLDGFTHFNICAPNLRFFEVRGVFNDLTFQNTFQLNKVVIDLDANVKSEQSALLGSSNKLLRFLDSLPHIRSLKVQGYFLKYLTIGNTLSRLPKPCLDLKYLSLSINFNDLKENSAALCLLTSVPNMQEIEMVAKARRKEQTLAGGVSNNWEDYYWSNLFGQLRIVRIAAISVSRSELDFIYFMLSNSPVLEKMTVKPASNDGSSKLTKELMRFPRASARAEIIYMDP